VFARLCGAAGCGAHVAHAMALAGGWTVLRRVRVALMAAAAAVLGHPPQRPPPQPRIPAQRRAPALRYVKGVGLTGSLWLWCAAAFGITSKQAFRE
jgi:hypothetical protein